MPYSVEH